MSDPTPTPEPGDLPAFVEVYSTRTGRKLPAPVPRHYLDHPVLGRNLSLTPRQGATTGLPGIPAPAIPAGPTSAPSTGDDTTTTVPGTSRKEK